MESSPAPALRVLVVEDNDDASTALALLLDLSGHAVRIAPDGPSALEAARAWEPDAVLLDLGLPGLNGYEVARQLRAVGLARRPLIVVVSGYGTDEDRRRSAEAGADQHLLKPADPVLLLGLLARLRDLRSRPPA